MISIVQTIHAGNALRLFIEPPASALRWKVLRKGSDSFVGVDDQSAYVAYDGDERVIVDAHFLPNNVMAFYKPFYTSDGINWTPGDVAYGTPVADFQEHTTDVLAFVRDRIEAGLKVEVERGNLISDLGYVQVYTAPPSLEQNLVLPLVTITLESESPDVRAIGEDISGDDYDAIGSEWFDSEGWLASVNLSIVGWSLNSDERLELRRCIRRIILANLTVFESKGMSQINMEMSDNDAINGEYGAPLYQVMANFSCLAPVRVGGNVGSVNEYTLNAIGA